MASAVLLLVSSSSSGIGILSACRVSEKVEEWLGCGVDNGKREDVDPIDSLFKIFGFAPVVAEGVGAVLASS